MSEDAATSSGTDSRPRRILIVDDEPMVRQVLAQHLLRSGWAVSEAGSAEEGLRTVASGRFDLVLLDVNLPGMSGFQAVERFSGASSAPVVLMSGHADQEFRKDALLLGARDLLPKPIDLTELNRVIETLKTD
ncbi:response regulator [Elusimicrobiota bacterium]